MTFPHPVISSLNFPSSPAAQRGTGRLWSLPENGDFFFFPKKGDDFKASRWSHRLLGTDNWASCLFLPNQRQIAKRKKSPNPPERSVWSGVRQRESGVSGSRALRHRTCARAADPATRRGAHPGTPPGRLACGCERVRAGCALRGSARRHLWALYKVPRPPGAFPPACGWHWRGLRGGERREGSPGRGVQPREAWVASGRAARGTYRGALLPLRRAGGERGAAALPSLVRLGRRPQQPSPRAAAAPSEPSPGRARADRDAKGGVDSSRRRCGPGSQSAR